MKNNIPLELNRIEIITLADNYIDLVADDNNEIITRAMPLKDLELRNSIFAEHGFSVLIRTDLEEKQQTMLFDFGFSKDAASRNADALNIDLGSVEQAALSHGHPDHFQGICEIGKKTENGIDFVAHPAVFRKNRFIKTELGININMPPIEPSTIEKAGFNIVKTTEPLLILGKKVLFLGEIERKTSYEKRTPNAFYIKNGKEHKDYIEDDSALVMNLKGKGLVIVTGCAHSGIVNTVLYAIKVTGIKRIHAVMGGFHLSGKNFEPIIDDTVKDIKKIDPDYVIPTHCTGRKTINTFEREMPNAFICNMAGTTLTFSDN